MGRPPKNADNQQVKSKLNEALDKLNKEYGENAVFKIGDNPIIKVSDVISTGSLNLDAAIGVGGYPCGRIIEIYGPESSGKTTLCLHSIKECQAKGKKAAFIDMEHALDLKYAKDVGVNIDELILSQPSTGEEALNIAKELASTGEIGLIVIDSVAALVPKSEAEGEIGDSNVGKQARMISQGMRILTPIIQNNNVVCIFTNQIRMKIGVMFGSPETTAGGEALKFFASIRIDVRKLALKDGDDAYGNQVTATIKKNKVAPPFKKAVFTINYGQGIDRVKEVLEKAVDERIINKAGSWYSYEENKIGQGEDSVLQLLNDNSDFYNEIQQKVLSLIYGEPRTESEESSVVSG
jgi:recombination protein RecA